MLRMYYAVTYNTIMVAHHIILPDMLSCVTGHHVTRYNSCHLLGQYICVLLYARHGKSDQTCGSSCEMLQMFILRNTYVGSKQCLIDVFIERFQRHRHDILTQKPWQRPPHAARLGRRGSHGAPRGSPLVGSQQTAASAAPRCSIY